MNNLIQVENLHFSYDRNRKVLNGVNLNVRKGELVGIVGLNGQGKSTLLYALCGIIPNIYSGELDGKIKVLGRDISGMELSQISKKMGIVFQDPATQLFSPTVEDEIAFGPENLCVDPDEIHKRIERVLKQVQMEDYRYENPNNLSGGQKQLIAIASVLSMNPEILLFDEILSQIDAKGKKLIKEIIRDLKAKGKTIIQVEHELDNFESVDRILQIKNGKLIDFKGW